jgi:glycosyltransferase involved in cell wall biosynthesis
MLRDKDRFQHAITQGPLVSVIIATYNRGYIVHEAVESVLAQTYNLIEIIVVDDGSVDNTQSVLRTYGSKIRVLEQANAGPASARNMGIQASQGDIICFLDSDDIWLPTYVERQVALLEKVGPSIPCSLGNAITFWADGRETTSFDLAILKPQLEEGLWLNVLEVLLTRFVMCNQMLAIRRSALNKAGSFDPSLRYMEDYDLALRLAVETRWGFIREPLVVFRQSTKGDSLSLSLSSRDPRLQQYIVGILQNLEAVFRCRDGITRSSYMGARIRRARRDLWVTGILDKHSIMKRYALKLGKLAERIDWMFCGQLPLLPKMKAAPI